MRLELQATFALALVIELQNLPPTLAVSAKFASSPRLVRRHWQYLALPQLFALLLFLFNLVHPCLHAPVAAIAGMLFAPEKRVGISLYNLARMLTLIGGPSKASDPL
jgi:hypothetical protein